MFMRKPQHKQFEYTPRFYDPAKDEDARRRRHFKFHNNVRRGSHRPLLIIILFLILATLLYINFQ
jgi:hypothetical protein